MRKYVSLKIFRSIYFTIFDSYLSYCCLVWAQNFSPIQQILILQKKPVRIINFQLKNLHTSPLFKQNSILKFQDKICLENILFVSKYLKNLSPSIFNTWFISAVESRSKMQKQLKNMLLKDLSPNKIKTVVTNFCFKSY